MLCLILHRNVFQCEACGFMDGEVRIDGKPCADCAARFNGRPTAAVSLNSDVMPAARDVMNRRTSKKVCGGFIRL